MSKLRGYAISTGFLGTDHTYVKSDKPAFSWPCWGRDAGGKEICQGNGNATMGNCISQPNSWAGIIYGVTGVCHQTANRILYPAHVTVSKAGGYWASTLAYGVYGTPASMIEWSARLVACSLVSNDITSIRALEMDTRSQVLSQEDTEKAYLEKVMALYSETMQTPQTLRAEVKEDESYSLIGKELELMMEFRLGRSLDAQITKSILKQQYDFLKEKHEMDYNLYSTDLSVEKHVKEMNDLFGDTLRRIAEILEKDQFEKIFGLTPPDGSFGLIDPKIAVKVHARN